MWIGIDDTDSPDGMCTTYLGASLIGRLKRSGFLVNDAMLIRLNPNVRYKTRGNAAICLEVEGDPDDAFSLAYDTIEELADFSHARTNPGLVLCETRPNPHFYYRAVRDFCTIGEARRQIELMGARFHGWKNARGLIGATAAVCAELPDQTFELLAYRHHDRKGFRDVDPFSIFAADDATYPHTWDSVDRECNAVVCVPHSPDPVLFGIRGENPGWVRRARSCIVSETPVFEEIYRTNQGTDAHLIGGSVGTLVHGRSYQVRGRVATAPCTGKGGHVFFTLADNGAQVRCMAYEPTKGFRRIVRELLPGDEIEVAGSFKNGSINLEKINIRSLVPQIVRKSPLCPHCGRRMTSAGKDQGYKCRRCQNRADEPVYEQIERRLKRVWYEVPPCARRHLAKPLVRM
jgi:tRNA(Ile2)-agmatinylcytidine synthase